ncbi:MAG: arylsulfatase [Kiritimatiellae bacterium]|nr:arylsulfatase [Kiritimatiellia bacterium]
MFASAGIAMSAPPRPNVMLILADDLGFSDLGCYGGEIETPNLDRLAANGLRFTQFYNTARCWPTRAALLTGFYPQQVRRDAMPGVQGGGRREHVRPRWAPLLPAMLKAAGYRSYHSGKWHIDGQAIPQGFDRAYIIEDHDRYFDPRRHTLNDRPWPPVERGSNFYMTTWIAEHAIACLREHAREHSGRPFFHYVCFTAPHFPLQAPPEDIARYAGRYTNGWDEVQAARGRRLRELGIVRHDPPPMERELGPPYSFPDALEKLGPGEVDRPLRWSDLTEEQQRFQAMKMAIHAAMVDRMDREIGRILDQLAAMGAMDNTMIWFASDNGASAEIMIRGDGHDPNAPHGSAGTFLCLGPGWSSVANTPFRRHKVWVHEGGIATPLIVHWPAGIPERERGGLRHTVSHVIDFAPTVLELAGVPWPKEWEGRSVPNPAGRSLVPVLRGDGEPLHEAVWFCHEGHRALRMGDWKIVASRGDPWELYNLAEDRGETRNLAARDPRRLEAMVAKWNAIAEEIRQLANRDAAPAATFSSVKDESAKGRTGVPESGALND